MKYMGSKARHAKEILAVIAPYRKEGQAWVEPFVGGANMIDKVQAPLRIGGDFNEYVIQALQYIQTDAENIPELITEFEYALIRKCPKHPLHGFVGFSMSFGGKWYGGYRRDKKGQKGCLTNMVKQTTSARNSAVKQAPLIHDVMFFNASYDELPFPDGSLIYCDPPYEGTTKYRDAFNHARFWQWCRDMSDKGHTVFVSEYNAPADFMPIWEKQVNTTIATTKKATEKLFVYIPQLIRDGIRSA